MNNLFNIAVWYIDILRKIFFMINRSFNLKKCKTSKITEIEKIKKVSFLIILKFDKKRKEIVKHENLQRNFEKSCS